MKASLMEGYSAVRAAGGPRGTPCISRREYNYTGGYLVHREGFRGGREETVAARARLSLETAILLSRKRVSK
jgi:hypothetical protein